MSEKIVVLTFFKARFSLWTSRSFLIVSMLAFCSSEIWLLYKASCFSYFALSTKYSSLNLFFICSSAAVQSLPHFLRISDIFSCPFSFSSLCRISLTYRKKVVNGFLGFTGKPNFSSNFLDEIAEHWIEAGSLKLKTVKRIWRQFEHSYRLPWAEKDFRILY